MIGNVAIRRMVDIQIRFQRKRTVTCSDDSEGQFRLQYYLLKSLFYLVLHLSHPRLKLPRVVVPPLNVPLMRQHDKMTRQNNE